VLSNASKSHFNLLLLELHFFLVKHLDISWQDIFMFIFFFFDNPIHVTYTVHVWKQSYHIHLLSRISFSFRKKVTLYTLCALHKK
jgi:hypothetical protein